MNGADNGNNNMIENKNATSTRDYTDNNINNNNNLNNLNDS